MQTTDHTETLEAGYAAVAIIILSGFPDAELAAFNLALNFTGHIPKVNIAYKRAVEQRLIQESGCAWDVQSLRHAAAFEVNRRVDAGTWGKTTI